MTRHAALYARISSDPYDTALGVGRQIEDCQALAARRGWSIGQVFVDNDVSATSGKPRPQYQKMMAALDAGHLDALAVWDVDRLTRTPRELEDVVDLAEKHGVELASVGGEIDLATPQGRLTARIKGNVAKHETEQLARRVTRKLAERAEAGEPHGRPSYGWRRLQQYDDQGRRIGSKDVMHPEQAEVIRDAAAAVVAGDSLRSIVVDLNRRGVPPMYGEKWDTTSLRNILLRQRNISRRVHRGKVIGPANWEPILDEGTFARLTATLNEPGRRTSPSSNAVKYLLSGLARCAVCNGPMRALVAGKDGRTQVTYVCAEGYHLRCSGPSLDTAITKLMVARLAHPDTAAGFARASDNAADKAAREKAAEIRAKLDLAADQYAADEIDGQQLTRITAKLRPEWERWDRLARTTATEPELSDLATPDIAKRWAEVPLGRQRAAVTRLLDEIAVLPATPGKRTHTEARTGPDGKNCTATAEKPCTCRGFDAARIKYHWRDAPKTDPLAASPK